MPFSDLVERNGGQMLRSFAQGQYMKKMEFHSSLSEGVCSALSTHWVVQRSLGQDFYKRIETPDGRNEVAMLQERESGLKKTTAALAGITDLFKRDIEKVKAYQGPDKNERKEALKKDGDRLVETGRFLQEEKEKQHRFRAEYVESNTGMPGDIESDVGVTDAVQDVSKHEGFVIFGMNGEKGGHAVALYHSPRHGVRFFDPNFGEAYFEDHTSFETFFGEFANACSGQLGQMKSTELTTFDSPVMPRSPEDAELTSHNYLPLNLAFRDVMEHEVEGTDEEREPLLADAASDEE